MLFIAICDNLLAERRSGSKGVEMLTGLHIFVYWVTTYVADCIYYVYIVIHTTMIFFLMGSIQGAGVAYKMRDFYDVLMVYGVAQYFFVAVLSRIMTKNYMPDSWIIIACINALCVGMYHS